MEITGTRFGDIQVEDDKLLTFPEGIPGFGALRRFALLQDENISPFFWLQSLDEPEIALLVIDPFLLFPDYAPLIPDEALSAAGITDPADVNLLAVALVPEEAEKMTVNLAAPLVVHGGRRIGFQALLERGSYQIRAPIYDRITAFWRGGAGDAGSDA